MKLAALADVALDRSVALGYTRIGSRLRRLWWPGATSGIGMAMARSFAKLAATVHVLGRSEDKVRATVGQIRADRAQRPTTVGWHRDEDPVRVAHFLAPASAMTGTSAAWPGFGH